jgi:CheY-like chemotaxis protein
VKILLVEDNEMNRDMIARYLRLCAYTVITAPDGEQAIAVAQAESPDLILMDMSLPVLDGWETTRRLKAAPQTAAIPVIALTALAMAEDRQRCFAVGCSDYESKPVIFPRLLAKIEALLNQRPR